MYLSTRLVLDFSSARGVIEAITMQLSPVRPDESQKSKEFFVLMQMQMQMQMHMQLHNYIQLFLHSQKKFFLKFGDHPSLLLISVHLHAVSASRQFLAHFANRDTDICMMQSCKSHRNDIMTQIFGNFTLSERDWNKESNCCVPTPTF